MGASSSNWSAKISSSDQKDLQLHNMNFNSYNACQKFWNTPANFALFCHFRMIPSLRAVILLF